MSYGKNQENVTKPHWYMPKSPKVMTPEAAKNLDTFSENIFATAFFKFPELIRMGFQLIYQPDSISAINSSTGIKETSQPDFELFNPESDQHFFIEVTETTKARVYKKLRKRQQLRVLQANSDENTGVFLFTWEAITHPSWCISIIAAVASGQWSREYANRFMEQAIECNNFDTTSIPK